MPRRRREIAIALDRGTAIRLGQGPLVVHGWAIANLHEDPSRTVRILFAVDPQRCAILLVACDEQPMEAW